MAGKTGPGPRFGRRWHPEELAGYARRAGAAGFAGGVAEAGADSAVGEFSLEGPGGRLDGIFPDLPPQTCSRT